MDNKLALGRALTAYARYTTQVRNFNPKLQPMRFDTWLKSITDLDAVLKTVKCNTSGRARSG